MVKNQQYGEEWTEKVAFIPPPTSTRPMCLICQETAAVLKISNLKRHYETRHRKFDTFAQNLEVRTTKINALKSSYQAASRVLVTFMTQQQKATECSLRNLENVFVKVEITFYFNLYFYCCFE